MSYSVSIQKEDFDLSFEVARLRKGDARVGAVCSFVGTVRSHAGHEALSLIHISEPTRPY